MLFVQNQYYLYYRAYLQVGQSHNILHSPFCSHFILSTLVLMTASLWHSSIATVLRCPSSSSGRLSPPRASGTARPPARRSAGLLLRGSSSAGSSSWSPASSSGMPWWGWRCRCWWGWASSRGTPSSQRGRWRWSRVSFRCK